jgi:hypothetical protein
MRIMIKNRMLCEEKRDIHTLTFILDKHMASRNLTPLNFLSEGC